MPDFLFVMQINGAVNEPKINGCDSIEVRNVAANGEIFICVFQKAVYKQLTYDLKSFL